MEFIDENALNVNLTRLKKTMQELSMNQSIQTLRGIGYRAPMQKVHLSFDHEKSR